MTKYSVKIQVLRLSRRRIANIRHQFSEYTNELLNTMDEVVIFSKSALILSSVK